MLNFRFFKGKFMKTALIAGAMGLGGSELVKILTDSKFS